MDSSLRQRWASLPPPSPPPHPPNPPTPQAIDAYQVEDYRLSASMNALNVAQSIVIFSGMAAGGPAGPVVA